VWWVAAVAAQDSGWKAVSEVDGCVLESGVAGADRVVPMRARCRWSDVDAAKLGARLADLDGFGALIAPIEAERIVRTDGDRTLVHQVMGAPAISDREVLMWMTVTTRPGCSRTSWTTASEEALAVAEGRVRAPRNDGAWDVCADPAGGASVVHEIAYDPGGSVPAWVVRRFQTGGLADVMVAVRAAARAL
jgi:hypothetical protein